jgi:hypothetical protein
MQRSAAIVTEERAARIKLCPLDNWERAPETSESMEHCVPEKRDDAAAFFSIRHPPLSLAGGGIQFEMHACCLHAQFFQSTAVNVIADPLHLAAAGACSSVTCSRSVCTFSNFISADILWFCRRTCDRVRSPYTVGKLNLLTRSLNN